MSSLNALQLAEQNFAPQSVEVELITSPFVGGRQSIQRHGARCGGRRMASNMFHSPHETAFVKYVERMTSRFTPTMTTPRESSAAFFVNTVTEVSASSKTGLTS